MDKIILFGGGGHCKSVIDTISNLGMYEIVGIIDKRENIGKEINGVKIIDIDQNILKYKKLGIKNAFITVGSIGNTSIRTKLYEIIKKNGFNIPIIKDKTSNVASSVKVGEGTFIGKGTIINADSKIGIGCIINTGSIIEHDCFVGDFVHISPGVTLNGGVQIGKNTHIATNSTIIQYINIGENAFIGAGSVVVRDIKSNVKAYGVPCKEIN